MKIKNVIIYIFNHIEEGFLTISFAAMAIICFIQVVTRFILHYSIPWSEEFLRALFIWSSCMGASCAFKTKSHLGVDAFVNLLPKLPKKAVAFISYIVCLVFCIVIIKYGFEVTSMHFQTKQISVSMGTPICLVSAALPVSFSFMFVRIIQTMIKEFLKTNKVENDDNDMHISEGLL